MTLSEELTWRGFINQTTYANLADLDQGPQTFYHGFDASADSQTIGNLAALMFDKVFIRHGYKALLLAGGATSLIGDPGGKDKERVLQGEQTIAHNIVQAQQEIQRVMADNEFTLVNNLDWTKDLTVIDFLRDIGKNYSMTPLLQRDFIAQRIGEGGVGITYTEFSYTLLQGMDYLHLFDNYKCTLQLGGSDQWGNCLSGVDLIRRTRGREVNVITLPLIINKTTGKKFGKSEDGAVWLDPAKTTPTQFYQFWINMDDEGVSDYIKVYTELERDAIDQIIKEHTESPQKRLAQRRLAQEVTTIVHGAQASAFAEVISAYLIGEKPIGEASEDELNEVRLQLPSVKVSENGSIVDSLSEGLSISKSDARRLIKDGAISINGVKTNREDFESGDFINGRLLLRKGKKFKDSTLVEIASL
jgi:tyrosyl-tRNA synthetase